jgi:hypothetical protein
MEYWESSAVMKCSSRAIFFIVTSWYGYSPDPSKRTEASSVALAEIGHFTRHSQGLGWIAFPGRAGLNRDCIRPGSPHLSGE